MNVVCKIQKKDTSLEKHGAQKAIYPNLWFYRIWTWKNWHYSPLMTTAYWRRAVVSSRATMHYYYRCGVHVNRPVCLKHLLYLLARYFAFNQLPYLQNYPHQLINSHGLGRWLDGLRWRWGGWVHSPPHVVALVNATLLEKDWFFGDAEFHTNTHSV
jgi:hypothetical protein